MWKTSVGDKCKLMRPKAPRVGDKWETSGRQVQTHTAQGTQSGRQVTSVNSCGPRHPTVRDKWETSVKSFGPRHPEWETSAEDKWETSVNSCGPRHLEWKTSVKDKCKLMRPKAPRVRDKCGRQV